MINDKWQASWKAHVFTPLGMHARVNCLPVLVYCVTFSCLNANLKTHFNRQFRWGRLCWWRWTPSLRWQLLGMLELHAWGSGMPIVHDAIIHTIHDINISKLQVGYPAYELTNPTRSIGRGLFERVDLLPRAFIQDCIFVQSCCFLNYLKNVLRKSFNFVTRFPYYLQNPIALSSFSSSISVQSLPLT